MLTVKLLTIWLMNFASHMIGLFYVNIIAIVLFFATNVNVHLHLPGSQLAFDIEIPVIESAHAPPQPKIVDPPVAFGSGKSEGDAGDLQSSAGALHIRGRGRYDTKRHLCKGFIFCKAEGKETPLVFSTHLKPTFLNFLHIWKCIAQCRNEFV